MGKGAGLDQFLNSLQRFGIGRLATIIGVSAGVAAALFALLLHFGTEPQALLYANLDLKEASSITQALSAAGIKYEAKGDGSTIMVGRDKVASTRLMLSSKGLPTSGSVGYEIFDNASALGQTDFVQNLNRQRALEGELARTIRSLDGVTFARVQLVLPKRQLFDEDEEQPSASVVIGVAGRERSRRVAIVAHGECVRARRKDAHTLRPRRGILNAQHLRVGVARRGVGEGNGGRAEQRQGPANGGCRKAQGAAA